MPERGIDNGGPILQKSVAGFGAELLHTKRDAANLRQINPGVKAFFGGKP